MSNRLRFVPPKQRFATSFTSHAGSGKVIGASPVQSRSRANLSAAEANDAVAAVATVATVTARKLRRLGSWQPSSAVFPACDDRIDTSPVQCAAHERPSPLVVLAPLG